MKSIVFVVNNMDVGGVQKSLHNLLWAIHDAYEVTLLVFCTKGPYIRDLPPNVKIQVAKGLFRYLGLSQKDCSGIHKLIRGGLAAITKIAGRHITTKILLAGEATLPGYYDCAVAYLQNGNIKNFYGGVQDYVLYRVKADRKIAFLHCDYRNCGANHPVNNQVIERFDCIAACSDGCRETFEEVIPSLSKKCVTVRNCHRVEELKRLADQDSIEFDCHICNVVMVSRLAHEKGIERAIEAAQYCIRRGVLLRLHIIGDGPMRQILEKKAVGMDVSQYVSFYGEQHNPYRYIKNADLFLMTSFHEAAPMVIEEARCLGVPVLTTRTTSSQEMVVEKNCGWVCENAQDALNTQLLEILRQPKQLKDKKEWLCSCQMDNSMAIRQFEAMVEG